MNNHFSALYSRGEQETSPDVVIGMFKVFSLMYMPYLTPVLPYHF